MRKLHMRKGIKMEMEKIGGDDLIAESWWNNILKKIERKEDEVERSRLK